jgi:hypothetical protein
MITLLMSAQGRSKEFRLGEDTITIGRGADRTIVLPQAGVSQNHARIERVGSQYRILDGGSELGTTVNGEKISIRKLDQGDEIRIGLVMLTVVNFGVTVTTGIPSPAPEQSGKTPSRIQVADKGGGWAIPPRARSFAKLGAALALVVALIVGVVKAVSFQRETNAPRNGTKPRTSSPTEEAEIALKALRAEADGVEVVTDQLVAKAGELAERFNRVYPDDPFGTPFDQLREGLVERRDREMVGKNVEKMLVVAEEALQERRYAEALATLKVARDRKSVGPLVKRIFEEIEKDFKEVSLVGGDLERQKKYDEAGEYYFSEAPRFEGTQHYRYLAGKPELLLALSMAEVRTKPDPIRNPLPAVVPPQVVLEKDPPPVIASATEPEPDLPEPQATVVPSKESLPEPPVAVAPAKGSPVKPGPKSAEERLRTSAKSAISKAGILKFFGFDGSPKPGRPVYQGTSSSQLVTKAAQHGSSGGSTFGIKNRDEIYVSWYLYLPPTFSAASSVSGSVNQIKLDRVAGAPPSFGRGWGRAGIHPRVDQYFRVQPALDGNLRPHFYIYHFGQGGGYGDIFPWKCKALKLGQWYHFEYYVKLNDPTLANGVVRGWLNGAQVFEKKDLRYRTDPKSKIRDWTFDFYFGGAGQQNTPKTDQTMYLDSVALSQNYLGPLPGIAKLDLSEVDFENISNGASSGDKP